MNKPAPKTSEKEIAARIADQAARAFSADRPLFHIVFYRHETTKLALVQTIGKTVRSKGLMVQPFDPSQRPEHDRDKLYPLIAAASCEKTLSLIVGLPRSSKGSELDGTYLNYLNLHRDRIAREKLRLVLFLHESDSEQFIRAAGDLWDFRHHTHWLEGRPDEETSGGWLAMELMAAEMPCSEEEREAISSHIEKVHALVEQTAAPEDKAQVLCDLSGWLRRRDASQLAAEAARHGILYAPEESKLLAELENELGYGLNEASHLSEALHHYKNSLAISKKIGDLRWESITLNNISQVYADWGRYEDALKALEESQGISRETGDRQIEGLTLHNIASIYQRCGKHEDALKALEESLAISRKIGDRKGEGTTLNNIATTYKEWGRYEDALKNLEDSLAIRIEVGDRQGEASTLNNISQIYQDWDRQEDALKALEKSLAICREISLRKGEGVTLNNIASIYKKWGRYDDALIAMEESLAISKEIGDRENEGITSWNLALEWERRGNHTKAISLACNFIEIKEQIGHPDLTEKKEYLLKLEKAAAEQS